MGSQWYGWKVNLETPMQIDRRRMRLQNNQESYSIQEMIISWESQRKKDLTKVEGKKAV